MLVFSKSLYPQIKLEASGGVSLQNVEEIAKTGVDYILISNASDSLNKLRQESILNQDLLAEDAELKIQISFDKKERMLLIADNGIGMTKQELVENLGTIARSGTQKFLEAFKEKKVELIGQFGVGFYSVFMVAQKVADSSWCVKLQNKALQTS